MIYSRQRPILEIMEPDIDDGVEILVKNGLSTDVDVVEVDPRKIAAWQEVEDEQVEEIAQSISLNRGWPEHLPLIVVGNTGDGYEVVDGNHRRAAAIQAGLKTIKVLAVDMESVEVLNDVADLNLIMEVFAANSDLMDQNQDLRWLSGHVVE